MPYIASLPWRGALFSARPDQHACSARQIDMNTLGRDLAGAVVTAIPLMISE
jgi:hypothetical protein